MTSVTMERPVRSQAFGVHSAFASRSAGLLARVKFAALSALRTERDARSLNSLHFAYWIVLSERKLRALARPCRRGRHSSRRSFDRMLFLSDFSGDWEVYLEGFNRVLRAALDLAWSGSIDWRANMSLAQYLSFVRRHQLRHQYYYSAYGTAAGVHEVRAALHVSEALDQLSWSCGDGRDPEEFCSAYRALRVAIGHYIAA
jgi:hypothetical protein